MASAMNSGALIGADVCRHAVQHKQIGQRLDHIHRVQPTRDPDGQALAREFVDNVEHAIALSIARAIGHEVVGPNVVRSLWTQPDARTIGQP
jgi:hypothetical protein